MTRHLADVIHIAGVLRTNTLSVTSQTPSSLTAPPSNDRSTNHLHPDTESDMRLSLFSSLLVSAALGISFTVGVPVPEPRPPTVYTPNSPNKNGHNGYNGNI